MLRVQSVSFGYSGKEVLSEIDFSVLKGQSVALIGESGSGKSTLLKAIYGLLDLNKGKIFWKAEQVLGPAFHLVPGMPFMKYLAQDFDLMPYVTVAENVGSFLSNFHLYQKSKRVDELLSLVGMLEYSNIQARYLSGGQMQRIALARVLALEPELLLLDEPFSHIDFHQKNQLARQVFSYCKQKNITVVYTSHNPEEILMFSDIVLVLKDGKIVEKETPQNIHEWPSTKYIGELTGEVNLIPVHYFGIQKDEVLLIRPHHLTLSTDGIKGRVVDSYYQGKNYLLLVQTDENIFSISHHQAVPKDKTVWFSIMKDKGTV